MISWIKENPALSTAIYGAIVSSVALGWNIYKHLQGRPKIKVDAKFGFVDMGGKISDNLLIVSIVNKGGKSIYLSSMGLRSGNDDLLNLHTIGLPCELKGGCSHSEWFEVKKLKRERKYDFGWYKDATGKMYKTKSIRKKVENYFNSEKEDKAKD
jgi:hypothetical protein